jgi:hypothetical protein
MSCGRASRLFRLILTEFFSFLSFHLAVTVVPPFLRRPRRATFVFVKLIFIPNSRSLTAVRMSLYTQSRAIIAQLGIASRLGIETVPDQGS